MQKAAGKSSITGTSQKDDIVNYFVFIIWIRTEATAASWGSNIFYILLVLEVGLPRMLMCWLQCWGSIHDILVLIRILGSVPLTNGSGSGSNSGCDSFLQ